MELSIRIDICHLLLALCLMLLVIYYAQNYADIIG